MKPNITAVSLHLSQRGLELLGNLRPVTGDLVLVSRPDLVLRAPAAKLIADMVGRLDKF